MRPDWSRSVYELSRPLRNSDGDMQAERSCLQQTLKSRQIPYNALYVHWESGPEAHYPHRRHRNGERARLPDSKPVWQSS
jgi:hypothetical protein